MVAIRLKGMVTQEGRIILDIPVDMPPGEVELLINVEKISDAPNGNAEIEDTPLARARAKFAAAGIRRPRFNVPLGTVRPTEEELDELGNFSIEPLTFDQIIDEDRGEY